jgi:parallel beta-helix repeat protein
MLIAGYPLAGDNAWAKEKPMRNAGAVFYVAPAGSDAWSGRSANANGGKTDGPFASVQKARDAIRALTAKGQVTGPITVYVRGGTYFLPEPLVFTPEDAGTEKAPVTYAAYPGETPLLSGGRKITGWKRGEKGLWNAEVPEVKEGKAYFRQLWVNGERRLRARTPNEGFFKVAELPGVDPKANYRTPMKQFRFAPGDIRSTWTNLGDVEVVALHFWVDTHLPIATVDDATRMVTFTRSSRRKLTDDYKKEGARYYVDNVYEGLDAPGEWYLNRATGILSYLPKPGEDMTRAAVIAPRLVDLVRFEGDPAAGKFVEHVTLRGLAFSHNEWALPPGDAGDLQAANTVPGALYLKGARGCAIEQCKLTNFGTYGIQLAEGCTQIRITRNEIADGGAGGIKASGGDAQSADALRTGHNVIEDNHIHDLGRIYHSGVGVLLQHSGSNTVAHNHIHHLFYTGISAGWVWGYKPSVSTGNRIEFNHIHDIGQGLLSDMGGIYLLGVSPSTVVRNNRIHDIRSWGYGGWGIYTDQGSSGILIENNVVYRTKSGGFHQHYGRENIVRNNIFALAKEEQIARTRKEDHLSFTFERNIVYWSGDGPLLGKNWEGDGFRMDNNLYFRQGGQPFPFAGQTFDAWQKRGQDTHSRIADPRFVDPQKDNFALKPDSPALKLGFQPIELSSVGVRQNKG